MTTEERDARLTAYALNDPGVTPAARQEIEAMLANDPAARQAVEETRRLAQVLTAALAAEQAAMPAESAVTIPATKPVERNGRSWTKYIVAAAAVLVAFGGTYLIWSKWKTNREDWPERIVETSVARVAAGTEEPNDRESLEGYPRSREFEPKRAYPRSSSGGEPDENTKALEEGPRPEPRSKGNGAGG
ncbi:MAG TPA: hypothetical protein VKE40_07120, partial [Gemmataceae bacterium]|nr:hypothetical protein [Gemmataceae bacterium]